MPPIEAALSKISEFRGQRRTAEAIALVEYWARKPAEPRFRAQLGALAANLGLLALAHDLLAKALPAIEAPAMRWLATLHLATTELSLGQFDTGLPRFASTRTTAGAEIMTRLWGDNQWFVRNADRYIWDQPVVGKTVMVMAEGGAGDRFEMSRYAEDLKRDGAERVIFQAEAREVDVLMTNPWIDEVLLADAFMERLAAHEDAVFTILFTLRARYQAHPYFPARQFPYLSAPDKANASAPASRVGQKPRVGLVWKSDSGARAEPFRSIPLEALEPLLALTGVEWFSLQVGEKTPIESELLHRHGVVDLSGQIETFGDTAAVLSDLDLLVSMCTGAVHLAGAMGRDVWVLLCGCADSRWANFNRFTPLYPSMRLFRQASLGVWTGVLDDVQQALKRLAADELA